MKKRDRTYPRLADEGTAARQTAKTGNGRAKDGTMPGRFEPRSGRTATSVVPQSGQCWPRWRRLKADAGCDSAQKKLLAERAAFVACQLETAEVNAVEGGKMDVGAYVQAVNCLLGLLRALGLNRQTKQLGLRGYVRSKGA